MSTLPWKKGRVTLGYFSCPPSEYGILPFWFLNGRLDPKELLYQLKEFQQKGFPGVILQGRYGLEMPYLGSKYLNHIRWIVEEAEKLGLKTWVYDEMNWPSGTADKRVLKAHPELSQRYIECISFNVHGPQFTFMIGADSRYNDFQDSQPLAAFALGIGEANHGAMIDLTPNLSFKNVIPWEVQDGNWRMSYIVEKKADYYIDALDPEATSEFLRQGYEPYVRALGEHMACSMIGFYTDEPAMYYFHITADHAVLPWTKNMLARFQEVNGYSLRLRLLDLFYDIRPDSARVRYDFYNTITDIYSHSYYQQIHAWCQEHKVLFTGHLLYEEWLRKMIRVEGNPFKHYAHFDIPGVDHLFACIGDRDHPDEHVSIKLASSAAHHLGRERLLCESFGGIFMDATLQRMKWIADWECVLGVNLINPHGFHYTLEGQRKRDWPPSMFYQFPWWRGFRHFSEYISRLSSMLTGGYHIAKVALLWPIQAMFASYTPQKHNPLADRTECDFYALSDLLLRLHYDFDYMDEDRLSDAMIEGGEIRVQLESYTLLILPPITHLKFSTLECLERFVAQGGSVLGCVFLPDYAFTGTGIVDISERIKALFGVDPRQSQECYASCTGINVIECKHPGGGEACFFRSYAISRRVPLNLQKNVGCEDENYLVESKAGSPQYFFTAPNARQIDITGEVLAERQAVFDAMGQTLKGLIESDILIENPEIFYLHRVKDGRDIYFLVNTTLIAQSAEVALYGDGQPLLWDPSTGKEQPISPWHWERGKTCFHLKLPPAGSAFLLLREAPGFRILETNLVVDHIDDRRVSGYALTGDGSLLIEKDDRQIFLNKKGNEPARPVILESDWEFETEGTNALVLDRWLVKEEIPGSDYQDYAHPCAVSNGWLPVVPGAWSYQLAQEISRPYPVTVWYRACFHVLSIPFRLELIIDGFAGEGYSLFVNGHSVTTRTHPSTIDSQMRAIDITAQIQTGENILAIRLVVTKPSGGLLDRLKLTGDFSLSRFAGSYSLSEPRSTIKPYPWTEQGYPFYSGCGVYRRKFHLPDEYLDENTRIFLEPHMADDVLEVWVNGQLAGLRLWAPYEVELTGYLQVGENKLELRVANTLANLLNAVERPSGLAGAPRLVCYRQFVFDL